MTWDEEKMKFLERYPDCPTAEDIEVLDLVMVKKYALEILDGKKTVDFRACSQHYTSRLYDKKVLDFLDKHKDDKEVQQALVKGFVEPLRIVKAIHFHNYANDWYMDIECTANEIMALIPRDIEFLQATYNCHEWDEALAEKEAKNEKERPCWFWFALGEVLGTNLK